MTTYRIKDWYSMKLEKEPKTVPVRGKWAPNIEYVPRSQTFGSEQIVSQTPKAYQVELVHYMRNRYGNTKFKDKVYKVWIPKSCVEEERP